MKILRYAVLCCALLSVCNSGIKQDHWVEFALSTPEHFYEQGKKVKEESYVVR